MKRQISTWAGLFVLGTGMLCGSALAHHAFTAEFDPDRPIELTGTVTKMQWANPHAWIYMDVVGPDGEVVNWAFETSAANRLIRRGWRQEDLMPGTELVITGWQARNGKPTANASGIAFADGRRLFAGTSNPDAAENQ